MARLINNRSYRDTFVDDDGAVDAAAFVDEVQTMHRLLCRPFDHAGRPQPPWIPALGTGPWAAARAMSGAGGAGRNGALYRVLPFDPLRPADALTMVLRAVRNGEVLPLFVGNSAMARHVVLVTGAPGAELLPIPTTRDSSDPNNQAWLDQVRIDPEHATDAQRDFWLDYYDPADGHWHILSGVDLLAGRAVIAGWREPWFAVVPARAGQ